MKIVYICSPYGAKDGAELDRNIEYAQELTWAVLEAGCAPITPHLYITQCLDEKEPAHRALGMAAGLELLKNCDFVVIGYRYGVSEGMQCEINLASEYNIPIVTLSCIRDFLTEQEKSKKELEKRLLDYQHREKWKFRPKKRERNQ